MRLVMLATLPLLLTGCPSGPVDPSTLPCESEEARVELTTGDGLRLAADYRPAATQGRGGVILFHMTPPSNDRSGYPLAVRDAIAAADLSVLNVDRRGAGESEGIALEAYEGEGGLLDMEAAVRFLSNPALPCPVERSKIALVGASNGTTPTLDYVVGRDATLPAPAALVWMSPGSYTEEQNRIPESRLLLDALPVLWMYPASEPYSEAFIDDAAPAWRFVENGDAHGTRMFDDGELAEQSTTELVQWFGRWIP